MLQCKQDLCHSDYLNKATARWRIVRQRTWEPTRTRLFTRADRQTELSNEHNMPHGSVKNKEMKKKRNGENMILLL